MLAEVVRKVIYDTVDHLWSENKNMANIKSCVGTRSWLPLKPKVGSDLPVSHR